MDFIERLREYQKYTNQYFKEINRKIDNEYLSYLNKAIDYSFLSKGKRIRPIMNIAFYEAFGGKKEDIVEFSSAIEMIHTYSLIHDDLPAMDDDVLRRHKATLHVKFDEATAILAGDALLNQAYETLFNYLDKNFSKNVLRACNTLAECAGKKGMIIGQIADMNLGMKNKSLENLEFINKNKTGKLIIASVVSAGLLANKDNETINLLNEYSDNIGIAFQLKDDLLEVQTDEKTLGKSIDSDFKNDKKTYIEFMGIEKTERKLKELYKRSIEILKKLEIKDEFIYKLTEFIFNRSY